MPVVALTDRSVAGVKAPERTQLNIRDKVCPGLILKVSAGRQTKGWSVEYRWVGRKVRRRLGKYPVMSFSAAREAALAVQRQVSRRHRSGRPGACAPPDGRRSHRSLLLSSAPTVSAPAPRTVVASPRMSAPSSAP